MGISRDYFRNLVWQTLTPEEEGRFLEVVAGTYIAGTGYSTSSERKDRMSAIIGSMQAETAVNSQEADDARRLARKGVLELRRQRGLDTRPL